MPAKPQQSALWAAFRITSGKGVKVFDVWLTFPSNGVAWAFQIFTKYGPLPIMLAIFIIMVPFRPQVPKAIPMHYRRAMLQIGWTYRVALSFAFIAVMLSPAALISLYNSGWLTQNAFNSMNTMLVLVVGVAFQLPYLLMVHVWFPRPLNWAPNRNWVISPRFRVRAWIVYILIWMATEIMMVVGGVVFERPNASISGEEIMAAAGYYLIEGIIFLTMSVYIQYRISWRNPIPGVPLAVDMALRREDLNNVQKFATFILGAGVSRCLQFLAQLQYESGPFAISAVSLVLSWVVSITSLGIACIPTWWFMRKLDPSRRLMKELRSNVMSEKRDPNLFTLENFRNMLDYNEDELKAMNTNAVKSGATDEAKVAAANKLNKNYSQTLAQIAGLGEQHKDQVRRDYQARMDNLTGTRYQAQLGKAAGTQNMISGIGSSLGQLAMLYGMGSGSGGGLANFAGGK